MSEVTAPINLNRGTFRGVERRVVFEFYGHVITERSESIYSVNTAYEIGFTAMAAVDLFGPTEERTDANGRPSWSLTDTEKILQYMEGLHIHKVNIGHRVVTHIKVYVQDERFHVRTFLSHTAETLSMIDEIPVLLRLNKGVFKILDTKKPKTNPKK